MICIVHMFALRDSSVFKTALAFICILSCAGKSFEAAPEKEIDSLKNELLVVSNSEARLAMYVRIATLYQSLSADSAGIYAAAALGASTNRTPPELRGQIHHALGNVAVMQDSLDKAGDAYLKAAAYFSESKSWNRLADDYLLLGNIALVKNQLVEALEYYRKGVALAEQNGYDDVMCDFYMNTGNIHYEAHNYEDALHYYSLANEAFEKKGDTTSVGMVKQNLGLVYYQLNEPETALGYFQQAISIFTQPPNYFSLGTTYLNMAMLYEKKGEYAKAAQLLISCLNEMEKAGAEYAGPKDVTLSSAYALLGHIDLKMNDHEAAANYLQKGYELAKKNSQLQTMADICLDFSIFWEKRNNPDSSLHYFKMYHSYYNRYLDEDNIRKLSYQAAEFKFEQQAKALELERLKTESKNRRIQLILALVIAGLIIGLVMLYFIYKLGKTKLLQSQLEKQNISNELEFRNKELTTTVMYQLRNKEFILRIAEKLKQAKITDNPVYRNLVNEILSGIEFDSNTEGWKEFEICFQRVHVDFYKKLGEHYPDLSSNEIRLCAYLKLNLGTKDIAAITYQTTNSIDVARHRLRQKMGLKKEESLAAFLSRF